MHRQRPCDGLLPLGGATRRDLIQRLTQPFHRIAPELRESIEEQDAVMRERWGMYLSGLDGYGLWLRDQGCSPGHELSFFARLLKDPFCPYR